MHCGQGDQHYLFKILYFFVHRPRMLSFDLKLVNIIIFKM